MVAAAAHQKRIRRSRRLGLPESDWDTRAPGRSVRWGVEQLLGSSCDECDRQLRGLRRLPTLQVRVGLQVQGWVSWARGEPRVQYQRTTGAVRTGQVNENGTSEALCLAALRDLSKVESQTGCLLEEELRAREPRRLMQGAARGRVFSFECRTSNCMVPNGAL